MGGLGNEREKLKREIFSLPERLDELLSGLKFLRYLRDFNQDFRKIHINILAN